MAHHSVEKKTWRTTEARNCNDRVLSEVLDYLEVLHYFAKRTEERVLFGDIFNDRGAFFQHVTHQPEVSENRNCGRTHLSDWVEEQWRWKTFVAIREQKIAEKPRLAGMVFLQELASDMHAAAVSHYLIDPSVEIQGLF